MSFMETEGFKISLSYNQILELVRQLPKDKKVKLSKELAKETIDVRLSRLLKSFNTDELSQKTIDKEVEKIRTEIHEGKE